MLGGWDTWFLGAIEMRWQVPQLRAAVGISLAVGQRPLSVLEFDYLWASSFVVVFLEEETAFFLV